MRGRGCVPVKLFTKTWRAGFCPQVTVNLDPKASFVYSPVIFDLHLWVTFIFKERKKCICTCVCICVTSKVIFFVVLKIDILLWSLFRFQHDATIMKEAHFLFLGYAVSHHGVLALSFNATVLESPCKPECFCGVQVVIFSKFCLLVDLWTKALGYWGCEIPLLEN